MGSSSGFPRVVLVTGASAGVGRATVRAFAKRGASIGLMARGTEGLQAATKDVEALGGRAVACTVDVSDSEAVEEAATPHRAGDRPGRRLGE